MLGSFQLHLQVLWFKSSHHRVVKYALSSWFYFYVDFLSTSFWVFVCPRPDTQPCFPCYPCLLFWQCIFFAPALSPATGRSKCTLEWVSLVMKSPAPGVAMEMVLHGGEDLHGNERVPLWLELLGDVDVVGLSERPRRPQRPARQRHKTRDVTNSSEWTLEIYCNKWEGMGMLNERIYGETERERGKRSRDT